MKISDSKDCVAYYYKQNYSRIAGPILSQDRQFNLDYMRRYILYLTDKAKKTRKQKSIRAEIANSMSLNEMLKVVNRVIYYGDRTEFVDYTKATR